MKPHRKRPPWACQSCEPSARSARPPGQPGKPGQSGKPGKWPNQAEPPARQEAHIPNGPCLSTREQRSQAGFWGLEGFRYLLLRADGAAFMAVA